MLKCRGTNINLVIFVKDLTTINEINHDWIDSDTIVNGTKMHLIGIFNNDNLLKRYHSKKHRESTTYNLESQLLVHFFSTNHKQEKSCYTLMTLKCAGTNSKKLVWYKTTS